MLENVSQVWARLVFDAMVTPIDNSDSTNGMERPLREVAQRLGLGQPKPNRRDQMSACYLSQSVPPTLDMLCKYSQPNVHRGAVLGAVLGARVGDAKFTQ